MLPTAVALRLFSTSVDNSCCRYELALETLTHAGLVLDTLQTKAASLN